MNKSGPQKSNQKDRESEILSETVEESVVLNL